MLPTPPMKPCSSRSGLSGACAAREAGGAAGGGVAPLQSRGGDVAGGRSGGGAGPEDVLGGVDVAAPADEALVEQERLELGPRAASQALAQHVEGEVGLER